MYLKGRRITLQRIETYSLNFVCFAEPNIISSRHPLSPGKIVSPPANGVGRSMARLAFHGSWIRCETQKRRAVTRVRRRRSGESRIAINLTLESISIPSLLRRMRSAVSLHGFPRGRSSTYVRVRPFVLRSSMPYYPANYRVTPFLSSEVSLSLTLAHSHPIPLPWAYRTMRRRVAARMDVPRGSSADPYRSRRSYRRAPIAPRSRIL